MPRPGSPRCSFALSGGVRYDIRLFPSRFRVRFGDSFCVAFSIHVNTCFACRCAEPWFSCHWDSIGISHSVFVLASRACGQWGVSLPISGSGLTVRFNLALIIIYTSWRPLYRLANSIPIQLNVLFVLKLRSGVGSRESRARFNAHADFSVSISISVYIYVYVATSHKHVERKMLTKLPPWQKGFPAVAVLLTVHHKQSQSVGLAGCVWCHQIAADLHVSLSMRINACLLVSGVSIVVFGSGASCELRSAADFFFYGVGWNVVE